MSDQRNAGFRPLWPILLLALLLLLAACRGGRELPRPPSPPAAPGGGDEGITLTFAVYDWQQAAYQGLVEAFQAANPNLRVLMVPIPAVGPGPAGGPTPFLRLATTADVFPADPTTALVMAHQGLLHDLTPFLEADPDFRPQDFYPGTLEGYRRNGHTWGLPTTVQVTLICYDRTALDQTGLPHPRPGWTWDDFLTTAHALTVRQGERTTRWGFLLPDPLPPTTLLAFIEGRAGPLVDPSTDPPTPRFDTSPAIRAVAWFADLVQEARVMPPPRFEQKVGVTKLEPGAWLEEAAMAADPAWDLTRQRLPDRVRCLPFPGGGPQEGTTPIQVQGLVMSAGTRHPDAAWRWMRFLSHQLLPGPQGAPLLPARPSTAEAGGLWETMDAEMADTLRYALAHGYPPPSVPGYGPLYRALDAILRGEKTVEEAMAEAQQQAVAEIRQALAWEAQITPVPPFTVSPPAPQARPGPTPAVITFLTGPDSREAQRYRDLARAFHEAQTEVVVEVRPLPPDRPYTLQALAEAGDCFLGPPTLRDPQARTAVISLDPFLSTDPTLSRDDFYPSLLEPFTARGRLWGLPAEAVPLVVAYRRDLFDAAGLPYPPPDWTPDDLLSLARALTRGEGAEKQYGFVGEAYEGYHLPLILARLGGSVVDDSVTPPAFTLDAPATVEALRWYAALTAEHGVKPRLATRLTELADLAPFQTQREALIQEGRAAMWTTTTPGNLEEGAAPVGLAPLPAGPGSNGALLSVRGYFISARTGAREACWTWITFLTTRPEAAQGFPARRSVAESASYRRRVGEERVAAYRAGVVGPEQPFLPFVQEPWLTGVTYWLFRAYGQVVRGEAGPAEALAAAQRLADAYRACVLARDAFFDQARWEACLRETDPSLPAFLTGGGR